MKTVCPCCGNKVPEAALPDDVLVSDIRDRYEIMPNAAYMFLMLFKAAGRTIPKEQIMDHLSFVNNRKEITEDSIRTTTKHLRRAIVINNIPVKLETMHKVGFRLSTELGWHWRERPLRRARVRVEHTGEKVASSDLPANATRVLKRKGKS